MRFALAWIDISTGAFRVAETSADRLLADVFRVDPRELIVAEPVFYDPELKPVFDVLGRVASPAAAEPVRFGLGAGAHRPLLRRRDAGQLRQLLAAPSCRRSAGAIAYVEKTQKAERPPLSRPEREEAGSTLFIDPATRANLELLRTLSRQPRRLAAQGDRPHRDRRRRAAAGRTADGAADRPGSDRRAAGFGVVLLRRDAALRGGADRR